jgi:hypothetical protein
MTRFVKGNAPPPNTVANAPELQPGDDKGTVAARSPSVAGRKATERRDVLPPAARAKLIRLEGEASDARDAANSAAKRMGELRKALTYSANPPPNAAALDVELTRLDKQRSAQDRRHRELAALTTNISDWLRSLRNVVLEPVRPVPVTLTKNVSLPDMITSVQDDIGVVQSQLYAIEHAPPPVAELKQSAREYVAGLAQRGRPRVSADGKGLRVHFSDPEAFGVSNKSSLPFLAWLHQDAMVAALVREIDGMRPHPGALTGEQKTQRMAAARQKLEALERTEEQLITLAQEQGFAVLRRADASPAAVLGVTVTRPAA